MMITIVLLTLCSIRIGAAEDRIHGTVSDIFVVSKFRFDYTFSDQADGWLKLHQIPSTWYDAKIRCQAEGAILASPLTHQRQRAILKFVSSEPLDAIFTGVHATFSSGDFASIEGVPLSRLPITWSAGEPKGNSNDCLAMKIGDGTMLSKMCSDYLPYVCYKKREQLIQTECGTHDKEYTLDARTGSCYKFHRRGLTWSKAYLTCAAEGGYLAIINSDQEALVLKELYAKFSDEDIISKNPGACHIGFRDLRDGGSWTTIHGETLPQAGFNTWANGQPDNATHKSQEGEACGTIFRDAVLNDEWCDEVNPFICEMTPNSLN